MAFASELVRMVVKGAIIVTLAIAGLFLGKHLRDRNKV